MEFTTLGCGYVHSCGIGTDGEVHCWGVDNRYSESFPNWISYTKK